MSQAARHQFRPSAASAGARNVLIGRQLARLVSDMGDEPLTPEEAKNAAAHGGVLVFGARAFSWRREEPAVGVDCLKALDEGVQVYWNWQEQCDQDDHWDDWYDPQPRDSVTVAFGEAEWDVERQKWAAWEAHECGGFTPESLPVFMRRATPYEDAVDMSRRVEAASRRQEDLRLGVPLHCLEF